MGIPRSLAFERKSAGDSAKIVPKNRKIWLHNIIHHFK